MCTVDIEVAYKVKHSSINLLMVTGKMWRKQRMTLQETDAKRELPVYLMLTDLTILM